jgi:hypothetical protein
MVPRLGHARLFRNPRHRPAGAGSPADVVIVIRPSRPEDEHELARLAALDSAAVPAAPLLVAEADGELTAALSLRDGTLIADPFRRTAALATLLAARAKQLCGEPSRRRRLAVRLRQPAAKLTSWF